MRGTPHAHIIVFLHEDDKPKDDIDKIDQMMWAEIPIDYKSNEFKKYLDAWRQADDHRSQRWKEIPKPKRRKESKKPKESQSV